MRRLDHVRWDTTRRQAALEHIVENHDFVTLADPDGNLFDVIDKHGWAFGQRT